MKLWKLGAVLMLMGALSFASCAVKDTGMYKFDKNENVTANQMSGDALVIDEAARKGEVSKIQQLLDRNPALISARDDFMGQMPLHFAAEAGNRVVAELLIEKGADVNAKDWGNGITPLQWAVMNGQKGIALFLITKGANVNAKNNDGKSALKIAMNLEKNDIVELLKKHGAKE